MGLEKFLPFISEGSVVVTRAADKEEQIPLFPPDEEQLELPLGK